MGGGFWLALHWVSWGLVCCRSSLGINVLHPEEPCRLVSCMWLGVEGWLGSGGRLMTDSEKG